MGKRRGRNERQCTGKQPKRAYSFRNRLYILDACSVGLERSRLACRRQRAAFVLCVLRGELGGVRYADCCFTNHKSEIAPILNRNAYVLVLYSYIYQYSILI